MKETGFVRRIVGGVPHMEAAAHFNDGRTLMSVRSCARCGTKLNDDEKVCWRGCDAGIARADINSGGFCAPSLPRDILFRLHRDCGSIKVASPKPKSDPPKSGSTHRALDLAMAEWHKLEFYPSASKDPRVVVNGVDESKRCTEIAFLPGRHARVTLHARRADGTTPYIGADGEIAKETLRCVYAIHPLSE